jgi:hypothetical protein
MSRTIKSMLVGVLALAAMSAIANSAAAATINTSGGQYIARTTALQTLRTTWLGIATTISCNQTITLNVASGTYTVGSLYSNRLTVSGATFACNPIPFIGTPVITPVNLNWDQAQLVSGSSGTVLIRLLDVEVRETGITGCTFGGAAPNGTVNFSTNNGTTTGLLLGATLADAAGNCSGSTVGSAPYSINRAFSYTYTP